MMTDPIADKSTRIRNAVRVERPQGTARLEGEGRAGGSAQGRALHLGLGTVPSEPANQIRLHLKYGPNGEQVIRHVRRVSRPGRRIYSGVAKLKPVLNGLGIFVISTSRGVVSDREARQRNLGGEVLCEILVER